MSTQSNVDLVQVIFEEYIICHFASEFKVKSKRLATCFCTVVLPGSRVM